MGMILGLLGTVILIALGCLFLYLAFWAFLIIHRGIIIGVFLSFFVCAMFPTLFLIWVPVVFLGFILVAAKVCSAEPRK